MKNLCMGCTKRSPTCHSECEDYLAFWKERRECNKKALHTWTLNNYVVNSVCDKKVMTREGKRKYGG